MEVVDCLGSTISESHTFYVRGSSPQSLYLFVCWKYLVVHEFSCQKHPSDPGKNCSANSTFSCSYLDLTCFVTDMFLTVNHVYFVMIKKNH